MPLEKPYCDWVIEREFDFSSNDFIWGWLDSDTYLRGDKFWKIYWNTIHPWSIIDYHRIHASLAKKWPQDVQTEIWKLIVQVLDLGPVYRNKDRSFFSLPDYIEGHPLTKEEESKSLHQVREVLWLNKIWTHSLLSHNSKVTHIDRNGRHITITDLGWTIPSFVEANRGLIDTSIIWPNR